MQKQVKVKIGQTKNFGKYMLLVKTKLDKSKIPGAGIGLFADQKIPKGTMITDVQSEFSIFFTDRDIESMPKIGKDFLIAYGYRPTGNDYIAKGSMRVSLDNDRFMNHSDEPNTIETGEGTFANKDIEIGEEITTNYSIVGCDKQF